MELEMSVMTSESPFSCSTKPRAQEELVDYYFYRRLAHFFVPFFLRYKISPNLISFLSLFSGLLAAYFFYSWYFWPSGFFAVLAIVLDCADGQVARLLQKSSAFGRAIDGFCDYTWIILFWFAIYFSGYFQSLGITIFPLMLVSSISMILHCGRLDHIHHQICVKLYPEQQKNNMDVAQAKLELRQSLQTPNIFKSFLLIFYILQIASFGRDTKKDLPLATDDRKKAQQALAQPLRFWSFLGEGHHNTWVIIGVFLAPYTPYGLFAAFLIILIPMNLWMIYCERELRLRFSPFLHRKIP